MNQLRTFIFLLLISCLYGQAQNTNPDGFHTFYYPSGKKSSEGFLKDGKPEGYWKTYNENGTLIMEGNRQNFLLDSLWKFYNQEGILTLEVHYKKGKKDGIRKTYFDNEYQIDNFKQDTQINVSLRYLDNGYLISETPYESGLAHGIAKEYDTTGRIISITTYIKGVVIKRMPINRFDKNGLRQGLWMAFNPNGSLSWEGSYRNHQKNGFFKYYDKNGNFLRVEKYEHDQLMQNAAETRTIERQFEYYPNGITKTIAGFYNGVLEGVKMEYDSTGKIQNAYIFRNGILVNEGIIDESGLKQGKWKEFYETGELRWIGNYLNSKMQGDWIYYFPDGKIEMKGSYSKTGNRRGEWLWFYPSGDTLLFENYVKGKREGDCIEYDINGICLRKGEYIENLEEGPWYYYDNAVITQGNYINGKRDGLWTITDAKGNLLSEEIYKYDLLDGKFTHYYPNGKIKLTGNHILGIRTGFWYQYNENGELMLTTEYKRGIETKWDMEKLVPVPEAEE